MTRRDHHDHAHDEPLADPIRPESARLERALREALIAKGIFTTADHRRQIDLMESRHPALGAKLVARAWTDSAFKSRLLADATTAAREMDIDMANMPALVVLENTAERHHLVVCTLCSCYPKAILGMSPAWYRSAAYRARAVSDPRGVLAEFGTVLPETTELRVVDSTADLRYLVLPRRPEGAAHLDEAALAKLVTRDSMIGVSQALSP